MCKKAGGFCLRQCGTCSQRLDLWRLKLCKAVCFFPQDRLLSLKLVASNSLNFCFAPFRVNSASLQLVGIVLAIWRLGAAGFPKLTHKGSPQKCLSFWKPSFELVFSSVPKGSPNPGFGEAEGPTRPKSWKKQAAVMMIASNRKVTVRNLSFAAKWACPFSQQVFRFQAASEIRPPEP